MSGLYVYALVSAEPGGPMGRGVAGEPLALVGEGRVRAVTGFLEAPPRVSAAALAAHDAAVRRLADLVPAILPARFGQWLPDEPALRSWISAQERDLAEALAQVEGCVQMTLRVFGEPAPPPEEPLPAEGAGGPGTRYLEGRRREVARERSLPEIAPLREALRPLLRAERIERAGTGKLLATSYDLIGRGESAAYTRIVEETAPRLGSWRVTASGPWPPYAFGPRWTA